MEPAVILSEKEYGQMKNDIQILKDQVSKLIQNSHSVQWYTVEQAALSLHRGKDTVRLLCKQNKLVYKQTRRKIEISVKSVQEYILNQTAA